jgi:acetyl-CoA C-acetyltransferase
LGHVFGAAALVLATQAEARRLGAKPLAEILGVTSAAVDPKEMGLGPVPAVKKIQAALKLELADLDLIEINEAFAAQVLACERELRWDPARRNVKGGAIALGHPIGCAGARITVTLLHSLIQEDKELGLATLCVSGGQGMAIVLRRS